MCILSELSDFIGRPREINGNQIFVKYNKKLETMKYLSFLGKQSVKSIHVTYARVKRLTHEFR